MPEEAAIREFWRATRAHHANGLEGFLAAVRRAQPRFAWDAGSAAAFTMDGSDAASLEAHLHGLFRADRTFKASVRAYLDESLSVDPAALRLGQCRADGRCAAAPDARVRTRLFDGRADVPLLLDEEAGVVRYQRPGDGALREAHATRCDAEGLLCPDSLPTVAAGAGSATLAAGATPVHARYRVAFGDDGAEEWLVHNHVAATDPTQCPRLLCAHNRDECPAALCRRDGASGACVPR